MTDNEKNKHMSRKWGFLRYHRGILGVATFIVDNFSQFCEIEDFRTTDQRAQLLACKELRKEA